MTTIKSICVFCGSSSGSDMKILEQAELLGKRLAEEGISLIYGGSKLGIMGKVAAGAIHAGGKTVGIIPQFLKLKEVVHTGLDELVTTENMHQRKMIMQERSEAFITLPGGFGTLEELFEIITWAQLGLHQKPIGLLNINGFYDDLIALLKNMVNKGFLQQDNFELLLVDDNLDLLLEKMKAFKSEALGAKDAIRKKILKPEQT